YIDGGKQVSRYAVSPFSFLGLVVLARSGQSHYQRLFRVLRQADQSNVAAPGAPDGARLGDIPTRARATSNPGGSGHAWVKQNFVDPTTRSDGVVFLPARLTDNPFLNHDDYVASLA